MNRVSFSSLVFLMGSLMILFLFPFLTNASVITGTIVDENGEPVPDLIVTVKSFKGTFIPERHGIHNREPIFPPPQPSNTDATGAFTVKNIVAPSINQLMLFPGRESEYEVRGIEIEGITFSVHPFLFHFMHEGFPFGIEKDTEEISVKITVKKRMRIRGQVLKDDGTPLRNVNVILKTKRRYVDGGSGSGSGSTQLDNEGRFTEYVNQAAYYTITIEYQGQSAESPELLLEEGQRLDGLTLTLKGAKQAPRQPNIFRPQAPPARRGDFNQKLRQLIRERRKEGVWAVNPANRHAYKVITCKSPEEAIAKATEQGAHLVAINDKSEQKWLLQVYGKENYWIGFTGGSSEDSKKWDNGEPITYSNWDTQKLLSEPKKDEDASAETLKTYTVLIGLTGKWQQISIENPAANITKKAILEKKDLVVGAPIPTENTE